MTIKLSDFSKETKEVLKIFDNEMIFLDYNIDETVKSYSIKLWFYSNNQWTDTGGINGDIKLLNNKIAVRINDNGCELFTTDENSNSKYTFPKIETDFSISKAISSIKMSNPTNIELNKEIPIWVKIGHDKESYEINLQNNFKEIPCNAGVAVTITFSDKELK